MYHYISEIGTYKISQTMLYAQRIIPIIIKHATFSEIVAAIMLNGILHRTKLFCC